MCPWDLMLNFSPLSSFHRLLWSVQFLHLCVFIYMNVGVYVPQRTHGDRMTTLGIHPHLLLYLRQGFSSHRGAPQAAGLQLRDSLGFPSFLCRYAGIIDMYATCSALCEFRGPNSGPQACVKALHLLSHLSSPSCIFSPLFTTTLARDALNPSTPHLQPSLGWGSDAESGTHRLIG